MIIFLLFYKYFIDYDTSSNSNLLISLVLTFLTFKYVKNKREFEISKTLNKIVKNIELNQNPLLLKDTDGSKKILLFSNIEDKIEIYGKDADAQDKLLNEEIFVGQNIIDLSADITKYNLLQRHSAELLAACRLSPA